MGVKRRGVSQQRVACWRRLGAYIYRYRYRRYIYICVNQQKSLPLSSLFPFLSLLLPRKGVMLPFFFFSFPKQTRLERCQSRCVNTPVPFYFLLPLSPTTILHPSLPSILPKLISRKTPPLSFQVQLLIRTGIAIVVQTLDTTVRAAKGDVVEAGDGETGLRVRGVDEAFF